MKSKGLGYTLLIKQFFYYEVNVSLVDSDCLCTLIYFSMSEFQHQSHVKKKSYVILKIHFVFLKFSHGYL